MRTDMLERLRLDPGSRTLGELLQERQWAASEIERLRSVDSCQGRTSSAGKATAKARSALPDPQLETSVRPIWSLPASQLLRLPEVSKMVGLSRSSVYLMITRGEFPPGIRVGARARRWRMADIAAWQDKLDE